MKKVTCRQVDFAVMDDHRVKIKENEKKDKYLNLARDLKRQWIMKVIVIPIVIGALGTILKGLESGPGRVGNRRKNTERSPRDLRRLAVTQTPGKDH